MRKIFILYLSLIVLLSACSQTPTKGPSYTQTTETKIPTNIKSPTLVSMTINPTSTPTKKPTETPTWTSTRTLTRTSTKTPTPNPTATRSPTNEPEPLSDLGPWGIIGSDNGVWAFNADGTGLHKQSDGKVVKIVQSPEGGHVAFIVDSDEDLLKGLSLNVLSLPDGEVNNITDLQNPGVDSNSSLDLIDNAYQVESAVFSLAWSHDGTRLAFVSGHAGKSADLYIYSVETNEFTQFSSEPGNPTQISWSPNDKVIIYIEVESFGTGAGMTMGDAWAVEVETGNVYSLYTPTGRWEFFVDWVSDLEVVVLSNDFECGMTGTTDLRTFNIQDRTEQVLWGDYFDRIERDSKTGAILISLFDFTAPCNPNNKWGQFLKLPNKDDFLQISQNPVNNISWSYELGAFLGIGYPPSLFVIYPTGKVIEFDYSLPALPQVSPDGSLFAWALHQDNDAGIWVGDLIEAPQKIINIPARYATWSLSGDRIYFVGYYDNRLYYADSTDFKPILFSPNIKLNESSLLTWILP